MENPNNVIDFNEFQIGDSPSKIVNFNESSN